MSHLLNFSRINYHFDPPVKITFNSLIPSVENIKPGGVLLFETCFEGSGVEDHGSLNFIFIKILCLNRAWIMEFDLTNAEIMSTQIALLLSRFRIKLDETFNGDPVFAGYWHNIICYNNIFTWIEFRCFISEKKVHFNYPFLSGFVELRPCLIDQLCLSIWYFKAHLQENEITSTFWKNTENAFRALQNIYIE